jgi:hypothetical protein
VFLWNDGTYLTTYLPTTLHGVITQHTIMWTFTAVKTSKLIQLCCFSYYLLQTNLFQYSRF